MFSWDFFCCGGGVAVWFDGWVDGGAEAFRKREGKFFSVVRGGKRDRFLAADQTANKIALAFSVRFTTLIFFFHSHLPETQIEAIMMRLFSLALALPLFVLAAAASTASGQSGGGTTTAATATSGRNPGASSSGVTSHRTYNAGNGRSVTVTRGSTADGRFKTIDKNGGPNGGSASVSAAVGRRSDGGVLNAAATSDATSSRGSPYSSGTVNGVRAGRNSAATASSVAVSPRGPASTTAVVG